MTTGDPDPVSTVCGFCCKMYIRTRDVLAPVGKGGGKCSRAPSKLANYASFSLHGSSNFIAPLSLRRVHTSLV
jgi:hypothetical protein